MIHSSQGLRFFICSSIILGCLYIFMFKNLDSALFSLTKIGSWSLQWFGRVIRPYHKPEKTQTRTSCESAEGSHWGTAARLSKDTNYPYSTTWRRGKKSQDFMSYQNGTKFQEMPNEAKHNQGTKSCGCTTIAVRAKMARQTSATQTRHVLPSLTREYIEYHRRLIQDMQTKAIQSLHKNWLARQARHAFFILHMCARHLGQSRYGIVHAEVVQVRCDAWEHFFWLGNIEDLTGSLPHAQELRVPLPDAFQEGFHLTVQVSGHKKWKYCKIQESARLIDTFCISRNIRTSSRPVQSMCRLNPVAFLRKAADDI